MLKIRNLEVFYGNIRSLKSMSIFVDSAEIVTIIGSNGAGKTTLLKAVSGTAPSVRGRIYFEGVDITHYPTSRRVEMKISHVPEGRHVFPTLSVKDNLILGGFTRLRKGLKKEVADAYKHVVELFPVLKTREKQQGGTLSGGEQQMLTMGRALMADPKLLLLDEPSMGLAPIVKELIFDTLQKLRQSSLTMLLVEQEAEAALSIADRGYVLQNGEIVLEDTGERLLNNPQIKEAYLGIAYEKRG